MGPQRSGAGQAATNVTDGAPRLVLGGTGGSLAMVDGQQDQDGCATTPPRSATESAPSAGRDGVGADGRPGLLRRRWAELDQRASTVPEGTGVFAARTRRAGWLWLAASLPLAIVMGLVVHGESGYVAGWVLVSGLFTTPALVVGWILCRRVEGEQRDFWRWWAAGTASLYLVGCILLVWAATGVDLLPAPRGCSAWRPPSPTRWP